MENQLVREKVSLDQAIDTESTQILLEGDIIVPDVKPDMALLLQNDAKVIIERVDVSSDRVNFIGKLELDVLYIAKGPDKPIYSMSVSAPIDDFLTLEGVSKDMWVSAKAEIANIDYKMLNDRKINYRAVINVSVSADYSDAQEVVVDVQDIPPSQVLKSSLSLNKTIENKLDHFKVKEQITIPASKPNIREILQCTAQLANKDIRVANGRVNIAGEILVSTLFKGDDDESFVEFVENDLPFNGSVDVSGAKDDMFADVSLAIQDQYVGVRADADGEDRVIDIEISIGVSVKVYSSDSIEILDDAYATDQDIKITKTPVTYPRLVCRNRNQTTIKEVVQIDPDSPDILQIFKVKGVSVLDDIKIIEDKIIAEG
ncbi:MAG: DUF3794 domain-containing protein, partial [Clostridiales bacterium]|nr:DUF3794 domain-containing protein [Clostridiales bacterium]